MAGIYHEACAGPAGIKDQTTGRSESVLMAAEHAVQDVTVLRREISVLHSLCVTRAST